MEPSANTDSTLRLPFHSSKTLTEVFPCFFLGCKASARVKLAKTRHGPHSSKLVVIMLFCRYLCCSVVIVFYCCYLCCSVIVCVFYVLFVCKCLLYHCHRVFTQLQLTNISSYHQHVSVHIKPSSGSHIQCLAKITYLVPMYQY